MLDIETTLNHKTIWLCVTKDISSGEIKVWKQADGLWDYIKDATLIMHNGLSFDAPVLNRIWKTKIRKAQVYDTLLVSRLLEPSRENGHSLESWGNTLGFQKIDYKAVWQWLQGTSIEDCYYCHGSGLIDDSSTLDDMETEYEEDEEVYLRPCPLCNGTGILSERPIRETYKGECFDNPHHGLLSTYCIRDVEVTEKLFHFLEIALKEKGFSEESVQLEHDVAAIIYEQEQNGFKLDTIAATCLLTDVKGKLDRIYEQMQERWPAYEVERISAKTGKQLKPVLVTFNPGSRKQIGEKLQELGWKPQKFTEKKRPIIDEGSLASAKFPEAVLIAEYLMLQKRVAQIESWLEHVGPDGRVHGRVVTNGAVTGRMTHSGPNMAQIPNAGSVYGPECRACWTVEEGNVLVGVDASGLELRMLAHYMKDEDYVRTVCEGSSKLGTDVHTVNQRAAGLDTRDAAKTFIYAFL